MNKKTMVILFVILLFTLSRFITTISPISSSEIEININNTDLNKTENEQTISNAALITEINEILSNKIYYKQPLINTWSRSEIEYEINIYEYTDKHNIRFRLLINENEKENTRTAYQSRLDVMRTNKSLSVLSNEFSVNLDEEQVKSILTILQNYHQY